MKHEQQEPDPKRILSFKQIKNQLVTDELKYYKYETRIKVLRNYIKKLSDQRIQLAKELMECEEEQRKILARAIQLERQKRKPRRDKKK